MYEYLKGKKVLVTGGTGSIGSEIVRQVLAQSPEVVRIFSRDETKQYYLESILGRRPDLRYLIGDVREKDRLCRALKDIDVVFHAAALKQVPSCEYNPFEAVKTNVVGTQNVIEASLEAGVSKVIAVSTDKAINPTSTMGATKLLSGAPRRHGQLVDERDDVRVRAVRQRPQLARVARTAGEVADRARRAGDAHRRPHDAVHDADFRGGETDARGGRHGRGRRDIHPQDADAQDKGPSARSSSRNTRRRSGSTRRRYRCAA